MPTSITAEEPAWAAADGQSLLGQPDEAPAVRTILPPAGKRKTDASPAGAGLSA
jgi:hypothetical protein